MIELTQTKHPEILAPLHEMGLKVGLVKRPKIGTTELVRTDQRGQPHTLYQPVISMTAVIKAGRLSHTTPYIAGTAHCPRVHRVRQRDWPRGFGWRTEDAVVEAFGRALAGARWLPDPVDIVWCLFVDSGALDYASFEDWAGDLGFDSDSIKAKGMYDACLAVGLFLRSGVGEAGLSHMAELFEDFWGVDQWRLKYSRAQRGACTLSTTAAPTASIGSARVKLCCSCGMMLRRNLGGLGINGKPIGLSYRLRISSVRSWQCTSLTLFNLMEGERFNPRVVNLHGANETYVTSGTSDIEI